MDLNQNLAWKKAVHQAVQADPDLAAYFKDMCYHDPIAYCNGFVWTYDPRLEPFRKIPMILYPFQVESLKTIIECIGKEDLQIMKSRDMGASWLCCIAFEYLWHFRKDLSFLFGSRTENYVDNSENPKSLFWKLDFIHYNLPSWLMPAGFNRDIHRRKMHLKNPETRSVIDGESTTEQFARGDRRTGIMLDEFAVVENGDSVKAATRDATRSRIFNSTFFGTNNTFYDLSKTDIRKLRMHWSQHPLKRIGLYRSDHNGKLEILDHEGYPKDYKPILDGKLRSIAYDIEWRRSTPREMAQEWDIDPGASGWNFFTVEAIERAVRTVARPPIHVGDLDYDAVTCDPIEFRLNESGFMKLWVQLDHGKIITGNKIIVGVDVSAGTGNSNSTACGWDSVTKEKIFEYANPFIRPEEFAKQVVAICRWVGPDTFLIWESNGPGTQFGAKIQELNFGNYYFRQAEESISRRVADKPGWASTKTSKRNMLGRYRRAIESEVCGNRSKVALEECLEYVFDASGGVSHSRETNKQDPTGARGNHGDRVIADGLAWFIIEEYGNRKHAPKAAAPTAPIGSLAWRNKMRQQKKDLESLDVTSSKGW